MSPDFHRQFISSSRMTTSFRYHSRCYLVFVLKNSQICYQPNLRFDRPRTLCQYAFRVFSSFFQPSADKQARLCPSFKIPCTLRVPSKIVFARIFRDCLTIQLSMFLLSDFLFSAVTFCIIPLSNCFVKNFFTLFLVLLFRRFSFAESTFLFYHLNFLLSRSFFDFFIFLCCPYRSRRQLS